MTLSRLLPMIVLSTVALMRPVAAQSLPVTVYCSAIAQW